MNFTIITPSLNYGRYLGQCLASVADQTSVTIEHLVVDGGSTDDSAAIVARFPHVKWSQEADKGMSDAINKGFERASGDWVMWLNADDRLEPEALAKVLPYLQKSTADVIYGDWNFIDEAGKFLRLVTTPRWSPFIHVHHHCYIASTAAFYRKSAVIDCGHRLREDFYYVMDGEFYARLNAAGIRFEKIPEVVASFRLHGKNASQRYLGTSHDMDIVLAAERQHVESRAIRRVYGFTLFQDPYLNGLVDGVLWIVARLYKGILKLVKI